MCIPNFRVNLTNNSCENGTLETSTRVWINENEEAKVKEYHEGKERRKRERRRREKRRRKERRIEEEAGVAWRSSVWAHILDDQEKGST